ncbi:UNVERIFIED_CONTAM: hypothetical protein Sradi_6245800 [Sesamum radiatum]|uniref:Uncharacterized protein n=1 Tax=Sesamum radiatum TaxID=300843 RepID=A0AAW2KBB9_SESRA
MRQRGSSIRGSDHLRMMRRVYGIEREIQSLFLNYFIDVFRSSNLGSETINEYLAQFHPRVSDAINANLTRPFSSNEVQQAINQMHLLKSFVSGDMPPVFFQKFCHIIDNDTTSCVLHFLNEGVLDPSLNHTHIVLLPKCANSKKTRNTHILPSYEEGRAVHVSYYPFAGGDVGIEDEHEQTNSSFRQEYPLLVRTELAAGLGVQWCLSTINTYASYRYLGIQKGGVWQHQGSDLEENTKLVSQKTVSSWSHGDDQVGVENNNGLRRSATSVIQIQLLPRGSFPCKRPIGVVHRMHDNLLTPLNRCYKWGSVGILRMAILSEYLRHLGFSRHSTF